MPHAAQDDELYLIARLRRSGRVRPAELDGDELVGQAVHEELRHRERQALGRRGDLPALRNVLGRATQQLSGGTAAQPQARRLARARDGGLRDDT